MGRFHVRTSIYPSMREEVTKVTNNNEVTRAAMVGHLESAMAKASLIESLLCTEDYSLDRNRDSLHYVVCDVMDGIAHVLQSLEATEQDEKTA